MSVHVLSNCNNSPCPAVSAARRAFQSLVQISPHDIKTWQDDRVDKALSKA